MYQSEMKSIYENLHTRDVKSLMQFLAEIIAEANYRDTLWRGADFSVYPYCDSISKAGGIEWVVKLSYFPVLADNSEGEVVVHIGESSSLLLALSHLADSLCGNGE